MGHTLNQKSLAGLTKQIIGVEQGKEYLVTCKCGFEEVTEQAPDVSDFKCPICRRLGQFTCEEYKEEQCSTNVESAISSSETELQE